MRVVIQRVSEASVEVDGKITGSIGIGLLVLAGFEENDTEEDVDWIAKKIVALRIFNDSEGLMNLSIENVDGRILLVSQFTLHALTKKGNRPSFIHSARPERAIPLYHNLINKLNNYLGKNTETGIFGASMKVSLANEGPVTILIDSKIKE